MPNSRASSSGMASSSSIRVRYRGSKMCNGITRPGTSTVLSGNSGSGEDTTAA